MRRTTRRLLVLVPCGALLGFLVFATLFGVLWGRFASQDGTNLLPVVGAFAAVFGAAVASAHAAD